MKQVGQGAMTFLPRLGGHRHVALIYDRPEEQRVATAAFIREGLQRGYYCLFVHDEGSEAQWVSSLESEGIDVKDAIAAGQLTLAGNRTAFLSGGRFDPKVMLEMLQSAVHQASEKRFEGLFVAGDMTFALGRDPGVDRLAEYEALCTDFFHTNPAVSLCEYDRRRFDLRAIRQILLTHPWILVDGRLCRNFHQVPPGDPLVEALELPLDVEGVLSELLVRDAAERLFAGATIAIESDVSAAIGVDDARRLAKIYSELVVFKREVLARAEKRAESRRALGRERAADVLELRGELLALQQRLDFWQDNLRRMVGLDYDPERRQVRFGERWVRLSRRESQLIAALISQNGRPLPTRELLWRAWGGNHLADAQVRTYVVQLRKKLASLELPASLVNEPGLGYSLQFDPTSEGRAATSRGSKSGKGDVRKARVAR